MEITRLKKELECTRHNLDEIDKLPETKKNLTYRKKQDFEISVLENKIDKEIKKFNEVINFDNCHLVVEYLLETNPKLMEAVVNEYEAQIIFGDKK